MVSYQTIESQAAAMRPPHHGDWQHSERENDEQSSGSWLLMTDKIVALECLLSDGNGEECDCIRAQFDARV